MDNETLIFYCPREPEEIKKVLEVRGRGVVKAMPRGIDYMFYAHHQKVGIQRKSCRTDFYASLPTLGEEISFLVQNCDLPFFLLEDIPRVINNVVYHRGQTINWLLENIQHLLLEIQFTTGVYMLWSPALGSTPQVIISLADWLNKEKHHAIARRASPAGEWGIVTEDEQAVHLLQGFPGVGVDKATRILEHFGQVPLAWSCTPEEMLQVPKIGRKTVEAMWKVLQPQE